MVPTSVNDAGLFQNLVHETNIYTIDAYPVSDISLSFFVAHLTTQAQIGLSACATPHVWRDIPTTWRSYHEAVMPETPFMFTESVYCSLGLRI